MPRLQARLGRVKVSRRQPLVSPLRPEHWKVEPNDQGRRPRSDKSKVPEQEPPNRTHSATRGGVSLCGEAHQFPGCTLHDPTAYARNERLGLRKDPRLPWRRPARPLCKDCVPWRLALAPASRAAAVRMHARCSQADAHLGTQESVCVAAEK
ncbi:hypothetical protein PAL_GLEAN10025107 [Pteropus alecto]|uniref:Uncharacterized protein n=1 Tax=Pteropus alecto TaxID=9402 RepID=L5KJV1_PTEAL|nr:hypothetical protein PAL_GLEAN10025107 [Pteropus alecto]